MGEVEAIVESCYDRVFRDLAWFEPDTFLLGREVRPVSLASDLAMRLIGLRLFDDEPLDDRAEAAEIGVFLWLHSAPIREVSEALWTGGWREILDGFRNDPEPASPEVLAEFRSARARLAACRKASRYSVRPKPRKDFDDDEPEDLVPPSGMGWRVRTIARETGWPRETILWRVPLVQVDQICHAADYEAGKWTVPWSGDDAGATADDFADFALPPEV